jgi:hypothetical protein
MLKKFKCKNTNCVISFFCRLFPSFRSGCSSSTPSCSDVEVGKFGRQILLQPFLATLVVRVVFAILKY